MSIERIWHASYAPGVPHEIDFEKVTMPEFLTRTAGHFPDVAAVIFMGKKISYRELEALVNRFANALTAIGVKAGDKVAMLLPNMPQLVIANYAVMRIGAVAVMNNPLAGEEELTRQVNNSGSTVLITLDLLFPRALDVKEKTGIRSIIGCHVTDYLPFPGNKLLRYAHKDLYRKIEPAPGIYEFLALLDTAPDTSMENGARWEETGAILYTDGTTGAGKGVMLTHANIACSTRQLRAERRAYLPSFHSSIVSAGRECRTFRSSPAGRTSWCLVRSPRSLSRSWGNTSRLSCRRCPKYTTASWPGGHSGRWPSPPSKASS
jgi:long-chain acyl-CoA synthetase